MLRAAWFDLDAILAAALQNLVALKVEIVLESLSQAFVE